MASSKVEIEEDLYEVLGVSRTASKAEIKKAYHKAALSSHPDKVPTEERDTAEIRFKSVSRAYEILSDDSTRSQYDVGGFDAIRGNGGPGASGYDEAMEEMMANMFASMGGGGGMPFNFGEGMGGSARTPPGKRKQKRRGKDEVQDYEISLEDLYKGKTTRFAATKSVVCAHCKGAGGKEKAKKIQCGTCRGSGEIRGFTTMAGTMTAQLYVSTCSNCEGMGEVYKDKDKCRKCHGKRTTTTKKLLELYIPPGSRTGDKIVLRGEADEHPDQLEPGDLVFVVRQEEHKTFERRGPDLCADITVTLAEALTGFERIVITHLDGRGISIKVSQPRGKVITPDQVLKISGEGMPIKKSDAKGDLYLVVKIEFPKDGWMKDDTTTESIRSILPNPGPPINAEIVDERDYTTSTLDEFGINDDDENQEWEDEGAEVPQCAQQ